MLIRTCFRSLAIVTVCLGPTLVGAQQPDWTPEEQEIIDIASKGPVGLEEDFDGWAAGYHREWSYWEIGTESYRPRDEHMRRVREYIESGAKVIDFELDPVYINVRGDMAVLRFNALETIVEPGGETIEVRFSSASIYVRTESTWKVFSTNIFYPPDAEE